MEVIITTPVKAYLKNYTEEEIIKLKKSFSFTYKSVAFLIQKHKKNYSFKKNCKEAWDARLVELESQLHSSLVEKDETGYWMRPGSVPYIPKSIKYTITNLVEYPKLTPIPWLNKPEFTPYPEQIACRDLLIAEKHANVSLFTGFGKSFLLEMLTQHMGLDTVIVTPSKSIFNELLVKFTHDFGEKLVGGFGDGKKDIKKKITIAIGRSITMIEKGTPAYEFFKKKKILLVDESHTFGATELEKVCHGTLDAIPYRFFVSGTQTRVDGGLKLLQSIIGKTVFEMGLKQGIEKGYACHFKFSIIETLSPSTEKKEDPIECKRVHFLYNPKIIEICAKIANASWKIKRHQTLILVDELFQIYAIAKLLTVPYTYVHSASEKDASYWNLKKVDLQTEVDKFNKGEVNVLMGTSSVSVGTNFYPTHNTINFKGGNSEIVTKQGVIGRSTRLLEKSKYKDLHQPKPFATVYDFRVINEPILDKQLQNRCGWYAESGGEISYYK
jgi:superfamily II DNA or RNA helicase